ncbi:MAG: methionine gamma-lyase family protein [Oscillospiraceae bacterium]|nr:methionine gamma-lyase family protein [Oscillospiraceae bacterium]
MQETVEKFAQIDEIALVNTEKVLAAFHRQRVSDACFSGTTGYGYNDMGREVLDNVFADVMGTETAIVRVGFVSGTHAISCALFAALRPGDTLLSVTGLPYDTLQGVIGLTGAYKGSLAEYGIDYQQVELGSGDIPDYEAIADALKKGGISTVLIQRSCGYSLRRALSIKEIDEICTFVHEIDENITVFVDNCYGEFVEIQEPGNVGADLIAGSLIKNPGGGLAPTGGYIAGRKDLVEAAANRLTAPGLGGNLGATLDINRLFYQGLFMAPHTVAQAVKTAVFTARLFELMGYDTSPGYLDMRSDIVQRIKFGSAESLEAFCKGIQSSAPINSFVTPVASDMPGYDHQVIMAAGTFIQGASIELSADAPMREPYIAYLQGGLTFESGKLSIMQAASELEQAKSNRISD